MTKVLLVDSDPRSAQLLSKGLEDVGHDVVTASTGTAAVAILEAERPDLVVTQAQADDMDGSELFTLVRKDPTTMETPFLLIAGRNRPVVLAAQEAGANLSVILGDHTLELILERVGSILTTESVRSEALFDRDGAARTAEPLWAALDRATAWQQETLSLGKGFAGSLDVIDLAEVPRRSRSVARRAGWTCRWRRALRRSSSTTGVSCTPNRLDAWGSRPLRRASPHPSESRMPDFASAAWTTPTFRANRGRSPARWSRCSSTSPSASTRAERRWLTSKARRPGSARTEASAS
jgi:CheY-like chemotaxis protein